jgi:hypothetical protein
MATYPQGVTTFIPDYQAYQPDFNFTANILQLKQSQYDQNWSRLNNIYGQILNAPLTHDESISKRDNTFKRIDFDLKRITGLDLSLEQNVQQATQLFRPFYEDASLMKDMAFTKNVGFEKSLGQGKRYNTDEKINSEYWDGGLRAIDYKVEEFKALPYDQLPSFGDVKYSPYVNVEKRAQEIAAELKIDVKRTTPQGDWIITQKNGEQVLAPLQATFYSMLGKDPKVQEMYATRAYLERKDTVIRDKDKPEYGGNAELAEKAYLNRTLNVMKTQTNINKNTLLSQKTANEKMISKLEKSIADGTDIETTSSALERYKQANEQIGEMLKQNESDYKLLDGDVNRTMSTEGGTRLSMDDLDLLRSRVDAVTGSNLLQADLNQAAQNWVDLHGEVSYDPNPFAVQRQKYQYDSSLIAQRAAAQKDVAYFKYQLDMDKKAYEAKAASGMYQADPKTGELKIKPELAEAQALTDMMAKTGAMDPNELTTTINDLYTGDAEAAKTSIISILTALQEEGTISNSELLDVVKDDHLSSFNMNAISRWLKENGNKPKETKLDNNIRTMLMEEGMYTTQVEKDMMIDGDAGGDEAGARLSSIARNSLDDVAPAKITSITKKLINLIDKKKDDPSIRGNSSVKQLVNLSHKLDDYADYRKTYIKTKEKLANEVANKMRADGFMYANAMFDDELNFVDEAGFKANLARDFADDIQLDNGMSWGGFMNTVALGASGGAAVGLMGGPFAPITSTAGFLGGGASAAAAYLTTGLAEWGYNALWGDEDNTELAKGQSSWTGHNYSILEEYEAMKDLYTEMWQDGRINSEIPMLNHPVQKKDIGAWGKFTNWMGFTDESNALYTANGAGVTVEPGVLSPTYQHYLEIQKVVRNLDLQKDDGSNYISFDGVNQKFDNIDDPVADNEAWAAIWADLNPRTGKKGAGIDRFVVGVSPLAGEDAGKAAIQFRLPEDYLKKFKPDSDGNGVMSQTTYDKMLTNGITIITDAKNLSSVTLFKNSYKTPEQIRIERSGGEGVTYTDPTVPGFSVNYKVNTLNPSSLKVTTTFPTYDPNTKSIVYKTQVDPLTNMGVNLVDHRQRFFNEWAVSQQGTVNNQRRQYER